jgi:large subunit ribosomal protein L30
VKLLTDPHLETNAAANDFLRITGFFFQPEPRRGQKGYALHSRAALGASSMRFIEVKQIRSPIRRHHSQRATLIGLGLNKIGRVRWVPDTRASRGMIDKVSHLIKIKHDPAAPKSPRAAPLPDEGADAALMRELAFDGKNIVLEPYSEAELRKGKTPDFKLYKDGQLCGYCELKSPRDDSILETPEPGDAAIRKNLPFYRKLGSHIRHAASQFDAVNPDHGVPNIMVFVSHAPDIERRDLHATIAGLPAPDGKRIFMLSRKMQEQVLNAARKVDLFLWIDAKKGTCQHVSVNEAPHQKAALELLGLKNDDASQ